MDGGDVDDINDRIEKLKKQAAELSAGGMVSGFGPGCTPEIQEQFWKTSTRRGTSTSALPAVMMMASTCTSRTTPTRTTDAGGPTISPTINCPLPFDRDRHLPSQFSRS